MQTHPLDGDPPLWMETPLDADPPMQTPLDADAPGADPPDRQTPVKTLFCPKFRLRAVTTVTLPTRLKTGQILMYCHSV